MVMATTASTTANTSLASVTLEVGDPEAARRFYSAFGVDAYLRLRASEAHSTGFRGFTLALTVCNPATVDGFVGAAVEAGATVLKPAAKSLWGYGGVVQAPDGTIWKIATSAKKDTGPATREIDEVVLLIGVEAVKATKQFYADRGLTVAKSVGSKYVEFTPVSPAPSSWRCTSAAPWPRTSVFPPTAPARTASSSAAPPTLSPTRTGLPGRLPPRSPARNADFRPRTPAQRQARCRESRRPTRRELPAGYVADGVRARTPGPGPGRTPSCQLNRDGPALTERRCGPRRHERPTCPSGPRSRMLRRRPRPGGSLRRRGRR